jgi:large subunit ribosomal protein L25
MTEVHVLAAEPRDRAGKGGARATRRAGFVPGVIYGDKKAPILIALPPKVLAAEMHKAAFRTTLYDVKLGAETHRVLARDVQFHPVSDQPLHVDFQRISKDSVIHVAVPVIFENELKSPGLKRGGVLNVVRHEVELVCRPDNIPAKLIIDLTGLDIGDAVHISHIKLPEGVRPYISDRDFTVATVAPPTVAKAADTQADAAQAAAASAASAAAAAPAAGGKAAPAAGAKAGDAKAPAAKAPAAKK